MASVFINILCLEDSNKKPSKWSTNLNEKFKYFSPIRTNVLQSGCPGGCYHWAVRKNKKIINNTTTYLTKTFVTVHCNCNCNIYSNWPGQPLSIRLLHNLLKVGGSFPPKNDNCLPCFLYKSFFYGLIIHVCDKRVLAAVMGSLNKHTEFEDTSIKHFS